MRGYFRTPTLNNDKNLQSYVIGLAIGDGNLSSPDGKVQRLRITCDKKYPLLINKITKSLRALLPDNKVSLVKRSGNCLDVSVYSNHLEKLVGWKARRGSKLDQKVTIPEWVKRSNDFKINCIRGLLETDGCIYSDRGYKMIMFTSAIPNLAEDFYDAVISLGFKPHLYKIKGGVNHKYHFTQKAVYKVRLCKNVEKFLDLVEPEKK